jgi:hypothetical protein
VYLEEIHKRISAHMYCPLQKQSGNPLSGGIGKQEENLIFEVLTAVNVKATVLWDVVPCNLEDTRR